MGPVARALTFDMPEDNSCSGNRNGSIQLPEEDNESKCKFTPVFLCLFNVFYFFKSIFYFTC